MLPISVLFSYLRTNHSVICGYITACQIRYSSQYGSLLLNTNTDILFRDWAVVRAIASHQCGPGLILASYGIEFVGSLLCTERFFSGYSGFPLSSKIKIWFDLRWFVNFNLHCLQLVLQRFKIRHINKVPFFLSFIWIPAFIRRIDTPRKINELMALNWIMKPDESTWIFTILPAQ